MSAPGAAAAAGDGAPGAGAAPGDGTPGAGAAANVNVNGGSSASQSSGGPLSGYAFLLLLIHSLVTLLVVLVAIQLRSCYVHDAYDTLSMLLVLLHVITRSPYILHTMIILLTFWTKICRYMTIFPTNHRFGFSDFIVRQNNFDSSLKVQFILRPFCKGEA